jgi:hypothetical protein
MKVGYWIASAGAALGLSLAIQTASAGSVAENGPALKAQAGSALTLVHGGGGHGGWGGGGMMHGGMPHGGWGSGGMMHGGMAHGGWGNGGMMHGGMAHGGWGRSTMMRGGWRHGGRRRGWGYGGWDYACEWPYTYPDPYCYY